MRRAKAAQGKIAIAIGFSIPAIILIAAYAYMAVSYKRVWLFDTVVHENGRYTLWEVILYFRHFTWELPMKILYAFYAVGALFYYGRSRGSGAGPVPAGIPARKMLFSGISAFGIAAVAIVVTADRLGIREALSGLLQYTISETKPSVFGSHWRNHFLSNIVLYSSTAFVILLYRNLFQGGNWRRRSNGYLFFLSWVVFLLLTLFFGFRTEQFTSSSYLGHQLRETFGTDLPITMLLAVSLLFCLENRYEGSVSADFIPGREGQIRSRIQYLWLLPAAAISGFLVYQVLNLDLALEMARLGQGRKLSVLDIFSWHFFEHSLDYLFLLCAVYFLYGIFLGREIKKHEAKT